MNRLIIYSRKQLKIARVFCTDYTCLHKLTKNRVYFSILSSINDLEQQNYDKNQLSSKHLFSQGESSWEPSWFYVHASGVYVYIINFSHLLITNMCSTLDFDVIMLPGKSRCDKIE